VLVNQYRTRLTNDIADFRLKLDALLTELPGWVTTNEKDISP